MRNQWDLTIYSDTKKSHKDLLSLPDNEIKDELESQQEMKKKQEEKIQRMQEIAREKDLAIPEEIVSKEWICWGNG